MISNEVEHAPGSPKTVSVFYPLGNFGDQGTILATKAMRRVVLKAVQSVITEQYEACACSYHTRVSSNYFLRSR